MGTVPIRVNLPFYGAQVRKIQDLRGFRFCLTRDALYRFSNTANAWQRISTFTLDSTGGMIDAFGQLFVMGSAEMWVSVNNGNSWTRTGWVNKGERLLGGNEQALFLDSMGVLKVSRDTAKTWNATGAGNRLLKSVVTHNNAAVALYKPVNALSLRADTVLWHSEDNGATWTPKRLPAGKRCDSLFFVRGNAWLASISDSINGRQRFIGWSGDLGAHWDSVLPPQLQAGSVAVKAAIKRIEGLSINLAAVSPVEKVLCLLITPDTGRTWIRNNIDFSNINLKSNPVGWEGLALLAPNDSYLYAVDLSHARLWEKPLFSTATWMSAVQGLRTQSAIGFIAVPGLLPLIARFQDSVYISIDNALTWTSVKDSLQAACLGGIRSADDYFWSEKTCYVAHLKTSDGGNTWVKTSDLLAANSGRFRSVRIDSMFSWSYSHPERIFIGLDTLIYQPGQGTITTFSIHETAVNSINAFYNGLPISPFRFLPKIQYLSCSNENMDVVTYQKAGVVFGTLGWTIATDIGNILSLVQIGPSYFRLTDDSTVSFSVDGGINWNKLSGVRGVKSLSIIGDKLVVTTASNAYITDAVGQGRIFLGAGDAYASDRFVYLKQDTLVDVFALSALSTAIPGPDEPTPLLESNLSANPNPFNPVTSIFYHCPSVGTLRLFDVHGKHIYSWQTAPGRHQVIWNGKDANGTPVAAGVYFVQMEHAPNRSICKLTLTR